MSKLNPDTDLLHFQCKDIVSRDIIVKSEADIEEIGDPDGARSSFHPSGAYDKTSNRRYQIQLFGSDQQGRSICLKVENYKPFFYVRFPDALTKNPVAFRNFERYVLGFVPTDAIPHSEIVLERHKTLMGFNNGELSTFAKITVPSQAVWRLLKDQFLTTCFEPRVSKTATLFGIQAISLLQTAADESFVLESPEGDLIRLKVYEANIDPVLRFFHIQNVSPAGWVQVAAGNWSFAEDRDAKASVYAEADFSDVTPGKDEGMAPYLVASWDIECTSSHGDFPIAKKTWKKPLREMMESGTLPETIPALCEAIVEAMEGTSSTLSRIYMKREGVPTAETLALMLEKHHYEEVSKDWRIKKRNVSAQSCAVEVLGALIALRGGRGDTDVLMELIDTRLTQVWPKVRGDEVIQIGTVLYRRGVAVSKHIWVLSQVAGDVVDASAVKPPGADVPIEVYPFRDDEGLMIKSWIGWIGRTAPDVLIGYNIFGFDSRYVWERLEETIPTTEMKTAVAPLTCCRSRPTKLEEKFLSSSAMGDNTMYFMSTPGRLQIDLLPYVRRNHILDSYSLDNVSATFMSGSIGGGVKPVDGVKDQFRFGTKSTKGIVVGRYITIMDSENDRVVDRCLVTAVEAKALTVSIEDGVAVLAAHGPPPVRWSQVKDDVHPKDIFRLHRGTAKDRAIVARYCLQDCDLVMELFNKLEILNNSVAMAQVSSVPVGYIFLRGQGIKAESLIFKECRLADQLIEVLPSQPRDDDVIEDKPGVDAGSDAPAEDDSYEGAIVLEPVTGIYYDPVTANDFSSLYPSSFISENISHDTKVKETDYNADGTVRCVRAGSDKYDNLPGQRYVDIQFDILRSDPLDTRKHPEKFKDGYRVARYIQKPQGTIPRILEMLLANRKKTRKLAEAETDEFRKALLDAQQLAYKLTANSLYGQMGSATFKVRCQTLAASCTAYGRKQLMFAKTVMEDLYGGGKDPRCDLICVYGDTDSIFLRFQPKDPATGILLTGAAALKAAKDLTIESGKLVSSCLKPPHDFEFDKIFRTFCLLSKKRYVGDMSEDGLEDEDFHRKSMGIVMKRRDNAPIVKYVYGGAIERILDPALTDVATGVKEATLFVQEACRDLLASKFPMTKLTITKSLRADYKDPTRIAHKVLADRIGVRDPGNKPSTSDRIPFVYIASKGPAPKLQGDRIETPSFIKEKGLSPDYAFYITNQIAKPVAQVFGLAVEHMPGVKVTDLEACKRAKDPVEARETLASTLLFSKVLVDAARVPETMRAKGQISIASFMKKV